MSNDHDTQKPGGTNPAERPLIQSKDQLTPEQQKRQRMNLIFAAVVFVVVFAGAYALSSWLF